MTQKKYAPMEENKSEDEIETKDNVHNLPSATLRRRQTNNKLMFPDLETLQRILTEEEQKQYEEYRKYTEEIKDGTVRNTEEDLQSQLQNYDKYTSQLKTLNENEDNMQPKKERDMEETNQKFVFAKLKEFCKYHIKQIVKEMIKQFQIDEAKWGCDLLDFTNKAVFNVQPSSQVLRDQMNFNSYVKIKIINWRDNSKSGYVNGVVLSNNLADRHMPQIIKDPTILILKDSLGFVKDDNNSLINISSIIANEEHYENILMQRLNQVKPNILIVEKDVSQNILANLRDKNAKKKEQSMVIITNISLNKIKRIARYTQTIECPSTNVINSKIKLGKCQSFRVDKSFAPSNRLASKIRQHEDQNRVDLVSGERNLIFFEGCEPHLGCTILISGDTYVELEELKKVKLALREMLKLARNVFLERYFLSQMNIQIPKQINEYNTVYLSPFLITKNVNNRTTLVFNKVIIKRGTETAATAIKDQNKVVTSVGNTLNVTVNQQQLFVNQTVVGDEKSNFLQVQIPSRMDESVNQLGQGNTGPLKKINENFVKTKTDSMCGGPKKEKLTFYKVSDDRKDNDKTLGIFLKKLCMKSSCICDQCKEPMFKHLILYYHRDGYVEISLELYNIGNQTEKSRTREQNQIVSGNSPYKMSAFCNICKTKVMQDTEMSPLHFEYSFARYLEQYFYSDGRLFMSSCGHRALRDVTRKYIVNDGIMVNISYQQVDVYSIEMIRPNTQNTTEAVTLVRQKQQHKIEENLNLATDDLLVSLARYRIIIKQKKRDLLPKDKEYSYTETNVSYFLNYLRQINKRLKMLEDEIKQFIGAAMKACIESETIFQNIFLERKILMNLLTFRKCTDLVIDLAALVLSFLEKRIQKIEQNREIHNIQNNIDDSEISHPNDIESADPNQNPSQSNQESFLERCNTQNFQQIKSMLVENSTLGGGGPYMLFRKNSVKDLQMHPPIDPNESAINFDQIQSAFHQPSNKLADELNIASDHNLNVQGMTNLGMYSGKIQTQQTSFSQQPVPFTQEVIKQNAQNILQYLRHKVLDNDSKDLAEILPFKIDGDKKVTIISSFHEKEEINMHDINNFYISRDPSFTGPSQRPSNIKQNDNQEHEMIRVANNTASQPQSPLLDGNGNPVNINKDVAIMFSHLSHQDWIYNLNNGIETLPLGTDSIYIPVKENDIGSIIAFVLASNIYKEALIVHNYMDIGPKIKGLTKHIKMAHVGLQSLPTFLTNQPSGEQTPMNQLSSQNLNGLLSGVSGMISFNPNQNSAIINQTNTSLTSAFFSGNINIKDHIDHIKLLGRNDVFNHELTPHQIETEMLCGESLNFKISFSSKNQDLVMKIEKNGNSTTFKPSNLSFQTGTAPRRMSGLPDYKFKMKQPNQKESKIYDLQQAVLPQYPKEVLEHKFLKDTIHEIDTIVKSIQNYYLGQNLNISKLNLSPSKIPPDFINDLLSPNNGTNTNVNTNTIFIHEDANANQEASFQQLFNKQNIIIDHTPQIGGNKETNIRESVLRKSAALGDAKTVQQPSATQNLHKIYAVPEGLENGNFCGFVSPTYLLSKNSNEYLDETLFIPKVDFELKIYHPKKFEALRKFYCGSQLNFIQSLIDTIHWSDVTGGKTKSKFYKTFDDKYVFKEIKKSEFKMFLEFAPQYFDYLCSSFFHNYPCALCKILGAFKITTKIEGQQNGVKKYIYITENMNFGIKTEDEGHIVRYDLKGSSLNRFVQNQDPNVVLHDNNFIWNNQSRPLPIRYQQNRILHFCINNDTLCLSKSNIIDYSLLTIIDKKRKKIRFGIIDFVQQYTIDKIFESRFKNLVSGEAPTIVDPDKYKQRFKRAMRRYFVGMSIQLEIDNSIKHTDERKGDFDEVSEDFSDDELNETQQKNDRFDQNTLMNQSNFLRDALVGSEKNERNEKNNIYIQDELLLQC